MHVVRGREEGENLILNYVCGECEAPLVMGCGGNVGEPPELGVRCAQNSEHKGFKFRITDRRIARRTGVDVPAPLDAGAARRQLVKLCQRYPDMLEDAPSAALFFEEAHRLSLDPLMSPAECVPVAFYSKKLGHKVIAMIISSDGWLSMAARSAPDTWMGAPTIEIITDPVAKRNISGSDHDHTIVVQAKGFIRDSVTLQPLPAGPVYGWYLNSESSQASSGNSGFNMASWRATKRWVRMNYPNCRQVMMQQTSDFMTESEGIKVSSKIIDAEWHLIEAPASAAEETSGAGTAAQVGAAVQEQNAHKVSEAKRASKNSASTAPGDAELFEPKELKNLGQFYTACNERWGLIKSEIEARFAKAGYTIVDLPAAWIKIKDIVEPKKA